MPKFAANLSTLFNEVPFMERFDAAAQAGFRGVEFLFPYEYDAAQLKQALSRNQLELVLFNTAPGNTAAGEWGVSAIPGREEDARRDIDNALEYALALDCRQVHIMAAVVPEGADRQAYCRTFIDNVRYAADKFAPHGVRILLEALNPQTKPLPRIVTSRMKARSIIPGCSICWTAAGIRAGSAANISHEPPRWKDWAGSQPINKRTFS